MLYATMKKTIVCSFFFFITAIDKVAFPCDAQKIVQEYSDNLLYLIRVFTLHTREKNLLEWDKNIIPSIDVITILNTLKRHQPNNISSVAFIYQRDKDQQHYNKTNQFYLLNSPVPNNILVTNTGGLIVLQDECNKGIFNVAVLYRKHKKPAKTYLYGDVLLNNKLMDQHFYDYYCDINCIISNEY